MLRPPSHPSRLSGITVTETSRITATEIVIGIEIAIVASLVAETSTGVTPTTKRGMVLKTGEILAPFPGLQMTRCLSFQGLKDLKWRNRPMLANRPRLWFPRHRSLKPPPPT